MSAEAAACEAADALLTCLADPAEHCMARHEAALALGSLGVDPRSATCELEGERIMREAIVTALLRYRTCSDQVVAESCVVALSNMQEELGTYPFSIREALSSSTEQTMAIVGQATPVGTLYCSAATYRSTDSPEELKVHGGSDKTICLFRSFLRTTRSHPYARRKETREAVRRPWHATGVPADSVGDGTLSTMGPSCKPLAREPVVALLSMDLLGELLSLRLEAEREAAMPGVIFWALGPAKVSEGFAASCRDALEEALEPSGLQQQVHARVAVCKVLSVLTKGCPTDRTFLQRVQAAPRACGKQETEEPSQQVTASKHAGERLHRDQRPPKFRVRQ
ncbi:pbs lyase heat-like repeat domain-containing protein [Cyclospora cayetanensis]|uniref:Pbs lyase heat-like repeat domain-containing protein n=1 Tax=Cyclospora cayetanensis TaxID=88456 RepID=A0A1D3CZ68_9EIME|nr:pbs lyase heat-like repeat domain-containing protein [Cyclospora cayetanensis]